MNPSYHTLMPITYTLGLIRRPLRWRTRQTKRGWCNQGIITQLFPLFAFIALIASQAQFPTITGTIFSRSIVVQFIHQGFQVRRFFEFCFEILLLGGCPAVFVFLVQSWLRKFVTCRVCSSWCWRGIGVRSGVRGGESWDGEKSDRLEWCEVWSFEQSWSVKSYHVLLEFYSEHDLQLPKHHRHGGSVF